MSHAARLMLGLSLIVVPTIIYGGLTVLGAITAGAYGAPVPPNLTEKHQTFYRAGHAHAGVLLLLSLILQILCDHAQLGALEWPVRVAAPLAAILVSAGFFGLAYKASLRVVLYTGAALVAATTVTVGVGLLRAV